MESEKQPSLEERYQELKAEKNQLMRKLEESQCKLEISERDQQNLQTLLDKVTKERDVALSKLEQEQKVVLHLEQQMTEADKAFWISLKGKP